ncbi:MAG: transglycosylase domain-containing protein [Saezia sp.]
MAFVKILFKVIFFLFFLAFLAITCFVIYIQGTKPAAPNFEQVKSDYSLRYQADNFEWTPFEELPRTFSILIPQEADNSFLKNELLESISSAFCIPLIQEGSRPFFFSRYRVVNDVLRKLVDLYDVPIRENLRIKSSLRFVYSCTLATDLLHHWGENGVAEAYFNLAFYGQHTYGIHAASHFYFEKNPNQLNQQEAVILLGLLEAPTQHSINPEKLTASSCRTLTRLPIPEEEKNCEALKPYIETFFNYRTRMTLPATQQTRQPL